MEAIKIQQIEWLFVSFDGQLSYTNAKSETRVISGVTCWEPYLQFSISEDNDSHLMN